MRTRKIFWILILLLFIPSFALANTSSNTRLLQRPEWDGAVVSNHWLNGEFRYQHWEENSVDNNFWTISPTYITQLPQIKNLELGSRLWLINTDYDLWDDEFGLGDIDVWAKYQFMNRGRLQVAGGLLFTLPLGDDGILHPKATGELNFEFFCASRYQASPKLSLIGHIGLRVNDDADVEVTTNAGTTLTGKLDGETQFMVGGGLIYQFTNKLNFLGELNYASEAYDNSENDAEITGGVEYKFRPNTSLKSGLGIGFDDGAPDFEVIIGITHLF